MNKVLLIGRVASLNVYEKYTRFSIACDKGKDKDGNDRGADFVPCVAFNKTGEIIGKYFEKGKPIAIAGHIMTGLYEKEGQKIYTTDVCVDNFEFVPSEKKKSKTDDEIPEGFEPITEEDMPF